MPVRKSVIVAAVLFFGTLPLVSTAQRFLSDYDSTLFIRDTVISTVRRFEHLHFSGYMQPQYQIAQSKGIDSYEGGDFGKQVSNRFMLRRARVKLDYIVPAKAGSLPKVLFTFQFEATERDVNVRDVFARVYEPKKQAFSTTMGLFARPFGFEVNLSSSFRETPERGRMSQTLMPSERDLGMMISWEPSRKASRKPAFKWDAGIFNGQGKSGPAEFDNYKDLISRFSLKPYQLSQAVQVGAGLSLLNGGWRQESRYRYITNDLSGSPSFVLDSSLSNIGRKALRRYHGADVQLELKHGWGKTEWRVEYWWGTQPGTATSTTNPGTLPEGPMYVRQFDGAFIYFLQNIINRNWELVLKYDWYDPNRKAAGTQIGKNGAAFTSADIRFNTLGFGLTRYLSDNLKLLAYYSVVRNERTLLNDYTSDLPDDVFTFRMQVRF